MLAPFARPARVDGNPGAVVMQRDAPYSIMSFTVAHGRITAIDILVDPERLGELDLSAFAE